MKCFYPSKDQCLLYVPPGLVFENSKVSPHSSYMYFLRVSNQRKLIYLYIINLVIFITEVECDYCGVQIETCNTIQ